MSILKMILYQTDLSNKSSRTTLQTSRALPSHQCQLMASLSATA